jgi:Ca2+-binding EF-hand superfamily protein
LQDLINDIRSKIQGRGSLAIRGLSKMFKILDNNGNREIDFNELFWGLKDFGIQMTQEQGDDLLQAFDTDGSGTVNFNEFLRLLRGEINDFRVSYIKKAYQKLDANSDGTVRLDDIAKLYDVSRHPDVINGRKDPKEVYLEFMKLWDTQVADGEVTFQEFLEYYRDVSASIDSDEYFAAMMKAAWKLDE